MAKLIVKSLKSPEETRKFEKGKLELVNVEGKTIGLATFKPGWRWSKHVKPLVKTEWCEAPHFQYQISGTLHVKMADGKERDIKAGEVAMIPPGHDGWVVGNKPVVAIDFQGMAVYAKKAK
jgi:quercetin dioxygenase-like cupin family protein